MHEGKFFGGLGRGGGHACGFLSNFSKVTENENNDKTIDFFSTSSVMLPLIKVVKGKGLQ